jgi:hypothetical protein
VTIIIAYSSAGKSGRVFQKESTPKELNAMPIGFLSIMFAPTLKSRKNRSFPFCQAIMKWLKKAISEHKRLGRLFNDSDDIRKSLSLIEEELEQHIRFEERLLFNEIQKVATEEQLKTILKLHTDEKFNDNTDDAFWE